MSSPFGRRAGRWGMRGGGRGRTTETEGGGLAWAGLTGRRLRARPTPTPATTLLNKHSTPPYQLRCPAPIIAAQPWPDDHGLVAASPSPPAALQVVPAPIVAITAGTLGLQLLGAADPSLSQGIETIGSHFGAGAIPRSLPMPHLPEGFRCLGLGLRGWGVNTRPWTLALGPSLVRHACMHASIRVSIVHDVTGWAAAATSNLASTLVCCLPRQPGGPRPRHAILVLPARSTLLGPASSPLSLALTRLPSQPAPPPPPSPPSPSPLTYTHTHPHTRPHAACLTWAGWSTLPPPSRCWLPLRACCARVWPTRCSRTATSTTRTPSSLRRQGRGNAQYACLCTLVLPPSFQG